ncbi:MAG: glycosyltransferase family 2 protein [Burkholderiales bacterium]|nr:glycosyltransferase family 2 protein [Burkholderiales bacterium]
MGFLLWAMVILLSMPAAIVALECLVACLPGFAQKNHFKMPRPSLAVLMPAHNESAVIAETLASVMPQMAEGDRLLLVADNCSDDTAAIARASGAQVLERFNDALRGKGYALAFGMDALRENPPDVLLIIDADCQLQAGALDLLAGTAARLDAPVQALYLMLAGNESSVKQKIAAFAWVVKNHVRALGMFRMGLPCPLMGTGMAFPWHIINRMNLATGALVEDMLLGGELVAAGHAPRFCPGACVTSIFPASDQDAHTQRRRWEHGHIGMIFNYFPSLLRLVLKRGDFRGIFFVFDMMVPPLALQSMLMLLGLGISGLAAWSGFALPFQIMLAGSISFGLALMAAWYRYAREVIGIEHVIRIPVYMLSKISVYVAYLFSREKNWVKTKR